MSSSEIQSRLKEVPLWQLTSEGEISRTYRFKDFAEALSFVNAVGAKAEEMDHHPDIDIRWNKVTLTLSTHSEKGLTRLDFELAEKADALTSSGY